MPVPELIEHDAGANHVGVVGLVVMGDPDTDESPELLDERVRAKAGSLLLLSSYNSVLVEYKGLSNDWYWARL